MLPPRFETLEEVYDRVIYYTRGEFMGCDIHSVVQVRKDGKWTTVFQSLLGDPRHYRTFSVLAGVRRHDTASEIRPPRGLPDDFEILAEFEHPIPKGTATGKDFSDLDSGTQLRQLVRELNRTDIWLGEHNHSWFCLDELQAFLKKSSRQKVNASGVLDEQEYEGLKSRGEFHRFTYYDKDPHKAHLVLDRDEYEQRKKEGTLQGLHRRVFVRYTELDYLHMFTYLPNIVAELERLAGVHEVGPTDIRYVFGFDG